MVALAAPLLQPALQPPCDSILSADEDARISQVLLRFSQRDQALYLLLLHTGLECSAAVALTVADVFLDGILRKAIPSKKGLAREIPAACHSSLMALIVEIGQKPESPLFRSRRGGLSITPSAGHIVITTIGQAAGLASLKPRTLRRTAARNHYYSRGENLALTADWLGVSIETANLLVGVQAIHALPSVRHDAPAAAPAQDKLASELAFQTELAAEYEKENVRLTAESNLLRGSLDYQSELAKGFEAESVRLHTDLSVATATITRLENDAARLGVAHAEVSAKAATVVEIRPPRRLTDFPVACELFFGDRFAFTSKAVRSLAESTYGNVEGAWGCIHLLANAFYPHYANGAPYSTVQKAVNNSCIKVDMHTAPITIGMFEEFYVQKHQGRKIELQKHMSLGTSHDPRMCFRLFFEWLPETKQILILHAGRHQPTIGLD